MQNFYRFEPFVRRSSIRLTRDHHMREDLSQEMRLDLWLLPEETRKLTAMRSAFNQARRYLRQNRRP